MENVKQYVIDYIEGHVKPETFVETLKNDPSVMEWLQSLIPSGKTILEYKYDQYYHVIGKTEVPYLVKYVIDDIWTRLGSSILGRHLNTFGEVSRWVIEAFPDMNIKVDTTLRDKYDFILDACPEYLCSLDIENAGILDNLMEELPEDMPKTKRAKEFRKRIKEMFYVEGQKYPRWIQESEWPLSKTGKPTKFIRQQSECKGEVCSYYFLDVDTGEEIKVVQAY